MKKIVFFSLLGIFGIPFLVSATSGACSWHGGVNCSIGADWDRSVICNDGWRDSSVSYYNADECKTSNFGCPYSFLNVADYNLYMNDWENDIKGYEQKKQDCINNVNTTNQQRYNDCIATIPGKMADLGINSGGSAGGSTSSSNSTMKSFVDNIYQGLYNDCQSYKNSLSISNCSIYDDLIWKAQMCIDYSTYPGIFQQPNNSNSIQCIKSSPDNNGNTFFTKDRIYYYDYQCSVARDLTLENEIQNATIAKCNTYVSNNTLIYNIKIGNIDKSDYINNWLENKCSVADSQNNINNGQILGSSYSENNPLGLSKGQLIKNKKFVEVFWIDDNLCLYWVVNEKAAEKHFGKTWNSYGNIKEFDEIPKGYKFCENLE